MTTPYIAAGKGTVDDVVARIERMPISSWHLKARFIGSGDVLRRLRRARHRLRAPRVGPTMAPDPRRLGSFCLPVSSVNCWRRCSSVGSRALRAHTRHRLVDLIHSVTSLLALCWDFNSLLVLRTLQGIGIGGEVPVAIAYIA
jgi:putative MFS transporter